MPSIYSLVVFSHQLGSAGVWPVLLPAHAGVHRQEGPGGGGGQAGGQEEGTDAHSQVARVMGGVS